MIPAPVGQPPSSRRPLLSRATGCSSWNLTSCGVLWVALSVARSGPEWLGVLQYHHTDLTEYHPSLLSPERTDLLAWPYSITVHHHCSISRVVPQDLAEMPAEDRRLAAEEGSYSLKTWLQKTEDVEAGRAPVPGPSLLWWSVWWAPVLGPADLLDGRGWCWLPLDPLDPRTPRASRP